MSRQELCHVHAVAPHSNLKQLKHQAKDLRKAHQAADAEAIQRLKAHLPRLSDASNEEMRKAEVSLQDCQHVIAREYGFESWNWLRAVVEIDFDLLSRFRDRDIQILLQEVDWADVRIALASALDDTGATHPCPEETREAVLTNMSKRRRAFLEEEMVTLGPVPASQVRETRQRILKQADQISARGLITWPSSGEPLVRESADDVSPLLRELVTYPLEEMICDGEESARTRTVLEELQQAEARHRMVIAGILSMQAGNNPVYTAQIVREAAA